MGPSTSVDGELIVTIASAIRCLLQWGRRQASTESAPNRSGALGVYVLQWGRRQASTESQHGGYSIEVDQCASMGPSTSVDGEVLFAAQDGGGLRAASMGPSTSVDGEAAHIT